MGGRPSIDGPRVDSTTVGVRSRRHGYGDPSVVVLDEPNANLDDQGERMLHETLRRAKARENPNEKPPSIWDHD